MRLNPTLHGGPLRSSLGETNIAAKHIYMVSLPKEKHPIMNFAVPFFKILTLYMLWSAQFLIGI